MRNYSFFISKKSITRCGLTIFALCACLRLAAQPSGEKGLPFITNYAPKQYNAPPQTFSVIEDSRGFMYFGIQNGILEYDGVKWRKVIFKNTPPLIRTMARDKNGVIYYGSVGDFGYLAHDSVGQTIAVSYSNYIPKQYQNFYDFWTIYVNGTDIYFQSREYIFRLNEKKEIRAWAPSTKFMYAFLLDGQYYAHEQGVGLLKLVEDSLQLIPGSEFLGQERTQVMLPYHAPPGSAYASAAKQYLIGMFYSGMFIFDGKTFKPFKTEADALIKSATLYKGEMLPDGNYVLSTTGKGLVTLSPEGKILRLINRDVGLQDESIYAVYPDSRGILWLGLDNGISRVETNSPLTQFTNQSGINTTTLSIERFKGELYLGTTNGLLKLDSKTGKFDEIPQLPPNQTFSLLKDGNNLLIANDGLFAIRDKKVSLLRPSIGGDMQLTALFKSRNHPDILLGGATFGVAVFVRDNKSGSWKFSGFVPDLDDQIWTFADNKDGTFWAGTQNGSAYRVKPAYDANRKIDVSQFVFEKYGEANGLNNAMGTVVHIKGENYFVGDSSLYRFDEKQKKFYPDTTFGYFTKGGGNAEFDVQEDYKGRLWIRFGKETLLATQQADGKYTVDKTFLLPVSERTFAKIYTESNGITWICTSDGLIRYDENLHKDYNRPFTTWIRNIAAGKTRLSATATDSSDHVSSISYHNNTMRFEYAAPFFEQEEKILYQTWLEGFESDWSDFDNNYYKEYTNLPAGKYSFHVRAKNVYHNVSNASVYSFIIMPPWYASWWAYTLYAITALALLGFVVRYRTRHLKAKHKELEKTVALRTAELSHRIEELAVINSVQEGLVKEIGTQDIYDLVGEKIRLIFNAQVIDIVTYDAKTNLIEDRYAYKKGDRTLPGKREPRGLQKLVIESRQVKFINEKTPETMQGADNESLAGEQSMSALFVPLISGGEVKGIISLQDLDKEHAFSESDVSLLTTLANSMSVALESARRFDETNRLLKETEQRNAELAVINSVQDGLVREMDIQGIYYLVGEKIREIFDAQVIDIVTYDRKTNLIEDKYSYEKGDRSLLGSREPNGFRKHIIETGEQIVINDNATAIGKQYNNLIFQGDAPKSVVMVPMITGGHVSGIVSLQNLDHEHAFSDSNVRLINTLANSMSIALESARLFDETKRLLKETEQRNAELAVINSVQDGLVREMDIQGIYELVGEKIREIFNAQVIDIVTYDRQSNLIVDKYAYEKGDRTLLGPRVPNGFRKYVIESGEMLVHNENVEEASMQFNNEVMIGDQAKSQIFYPLLGGGKVNGIISLQNLDKEHAFSESDISLLTTLANSMSVALESARLFDETKILLKETEQRKAELAVINNVQEGLVKEFKSSAIYELVGEKLCELFNTQTVLIRTFEHESGKEVWRYVIEKGQRQYSEPRPLIWANKRLIETHKPLIINENYLETAKKYGGTGVSVGQPPKSAVFVPMLVGGVVRGSVSLQNVDKEHAFTEAELGLLTALTGSMAVALENARLFDETTRLLDETKQRAAELSTVNTISQTLASQINPEDLVKLVGDQLRDLFKANIVYIALLNSNTKIIYFPYQHGDNLTPMRLGEGLTSQILLTGKALLINKDVDVQTIRFGVQRLGIPAASYLGVPIPVGDEIIGVLSVQSTETENRFDQNDERLLSTIAASVGVALRKAQLFEEVTLAKQQAEEASKIAENANQAKSAFLSTVSHELRTPLTSVLGFAKIIRKRLEEKVFPATDRSDPKIEKIIKQVTDNLGVVVSEGERLTNLINEVLDLAKIEAGKMEWNMESVSMQEVAERALAATTSLFEQKNLELKANIPNDLPKINGDRDKLIQVMVNLVSNAVKFTPSGIVTCNITSRNNEIITGITDTGIGIAPSDHAVVFEQFKQVVGDTLTDKPKGTGLGLPICKEIIEHHHGRIWLESEVGKGSTFYFALPVPKHESIQPIHFDDLVKQLKEQMAQSKFKLNGNHATILIVDDDDSIRSLLQQELGEAGYLIEEASNGNEALAKIRNHRPDLVILDVMMPEMNGFDVAAILKNDPKTMDIPIIVLSIVQDKARGYRIGVDRYLTKPIDTAQLFAEVGNLLEQGKSRKKVMVVDEDTTAVRSLTDVLQAKGYQVVESDGKELMEKAIKTQPDIIILNSILSDKQEIVKSLRFEKGLENVLFLIYQ